MDQENKSTISAQLLEEDGIAYLVFDINQNKHSLNISTENDQEEIKNMFCDLLKIVAENEVDISLNIQEGFNNSLLIDVAKSYIDDLNTELQTVHSRLSQ